MKLESRPSPRYPELMIFTDGRIYDANACKWVNTSSIHQHTFRGPVAYWSTVGKTYTLDVLKMVYEAHVSREMLTNSWIICFREGNEINPENLKKTRKYEKNEKIIKTYVGHDCWLNGDDCLYMW